MSKSPLEAVLCQYHVRVLLQRFLTQGFEVFVPKTDMPEHQRLNLGPSGQPRGFVVVL